MSRDSSAEIWVGLPEDEMPEVFSHEMELLEDDICDTCDHFGVDYSISYDGDDECIVGYRVFKVSWRFDELPSPETYQEHINMFKEKFGVEPKVYINSRYF